MEWPVVNLSNTGKLILFIGVGGFLSGLNKSAFTPGEIQPPHHSDIPDPSPSTGLQNVILFFASVPPLDPLLRGDRGSLNQGFKTVNEEGESQSEWRNFMQTKWAPDPLSHAEPNNWLQECSHFCALGYR